MPVVPAITASRKTYARGPIRRYAATSRHGGAGPVARAPAIDALKPVNRETYVCCVKAFIPLRGRGTLPRWVGRRPSGTACSARAHP